jgi:hypothetical protein
MILPIASAVLIVLGLIGTFPTFFQRSRRTSLARAAQGAMCA